MTDAQSPCTLEHRHPKRALIDARGIFCTYVCDACEAERRGRYRPEIFTGLYDADEPIDEDGW